MRELTMMINGLLIIQVYIMRWHILVGVNSLQLLLNIMMMMLCELKVIVFHSIRIQYSDNQKLFSSKYIVCNNQLIEMYRAIPTNNKICFDKDLKRSWKIHDQKLKNIKSQVSKQKPQYFLFLDQRPKKYAIEQFRNTQIAKENRSLLTKIRTIGEKGCNNSSSPNLKPFSSGAAQRQKRGTLNQPFRKRQLNKIVRENQEIMKRIQSKKSMFNVKKWEKQRKKIQKNITLISSFPYKDYPSTQTKVNLWMTEQDFLVKSRVQNYADLSQSKMKRSSLIFSGTQKIGQNYYLIQSYLNKKIFNVDIENLEDPTDKYRMEISEKQAYQLLERNFECDLRNLIQALQIDKEQGVCYLRYNQCEEKRRQS